MGPRTYSDKYSNNGRVGRRRNCAQQYLSGQDGSTFDCNGCCVSHLHTENTDFRYKFPFESDIWSYLAHRVSSGPPAALSTRMTNTKGDAKVPLENGSQDLKDFAQRHRAGCYRTRVSKRTEEDRCHERQGQQAQHMCRSFLQRLVEKD